MPGIFGWHAGGPNMTEVPLGEPLQKWGREQSSATLGGARFLAYLLDMFRSLRAVRLAIPSHALPFTEVSQQQPLDTGGVARVACSPRVQS